MTRALLLLLTLLACTGASDYPASRVYLAQENIVDEMKAMFPEVQVDVRWMPCLQENSFYSPSAKTIVLCTELEAAPGAAVAMAAHEMGHAITNQILGTGDEQDADEIAALAMIKFGYRQELLDAAVYFAGQEQQEHIPGDVHPGNAFRAWEFACIEAGSEGGPQECVDLYRGLVVRWSYRLSAP